MAHIVDLDTGQINTVCGQHVVDVIQGNSQAIIWQVSVTKSGTPADFTDCKCAVKAVRSDNATVPVNAQIAGNVLTATLTVECFAVTGDLELYFDVMDALGNVIMTVSRLHFNVRRGATTHVVPPGDSFPDLSIAISALTQRHINCDGIVDVSRETDTQYTVIFDSGQTYSITIIDDVIIIVE